VGCRIELDRSILPVDGDNTAVVKVTLAAPAVPKKDRPPVNLAIVLDRSGSMSGQQKLERAKDAAIEALRRLDRRDQFSLVMYDQRVEVVVPAQRADNTEWIESRIRGIQPGGNTALFGGVSQGAAEVRKHTDGGYVNRVILLSDGLANVGPSRPDDLARLGVALSKEGIAVTTVGVGNDYNEDLMTRLSQNSDGNSYFVESSKDLPRVFAAELGDVLSVLAKRVEVRIDFLDGVMPIEIIGRDGRISDRSVTLSLNQLYGGQEKYVLVRVRVPAGRPGDRREVASARVSYENALSLQAEEALGHVTATYSADRAEVVRSVNVSVGRELNLNVRAQAQNTAIALADAGKLKEAAQELRKSAVQLRQAAAELKDARLGDDASAVEKQAEQLEKEGLTQSGRKNMRTDSYQTINQQMAH
jgi:Ca-activated chloride channel family protein